MEIDATPSPQPTVSWRPYGHDVRLGEVTVIVDGQAYQLGWLWQYPGRAEVCAEVPSSDDDGFPDEATAVAYLQQVGEVMAAEGNLEDAIRRLQALKAGGNQP